MMPVCSEAASSGLVGWNASPDINKISLRVDASKIEQTLDPVAFGFKLDKELHGLRLLNGVICQRGAGRVLAGSEKRVCSPSRVLSLETANGGVSKDFEKKANCYGGDVVTVGSVAVSHKYSSSNSARPLFHSPMSTQESVHSDAKNASGNSQSAVVSYRADEHPNTPSLDSLLDRPFERLDHLAVLGRYEGDFGKDAEFDAGQLVSLQHPIS
jgi:hypothetical protein